MSVNVTGSSETTARGSAPAPGAERAKREGNVLLQLFCKRLQDYYKRNSASLFFRAPLAIRVEAPVISFTFDDFPRSALHTGGTILRRYGVVGTYYAALSLLGKEGPSGPCFVSDDLKVLLGQGHELGCHTFSHCHSWNTEPRIFEDSVIRNRTALKTLMPGVEFKSFSYPISTPRPVTKRIVAKYFECCRCGGQTVNLGTADLNQLAGFFLEKSGGSIEAVKDLVDLNQRARGWLIFATHDVCRGPSQFGCTPDYFERVVQYAVSSGARILPVNAALEALKESAVLATRTFWKA